MIDPQIVSFTFGAAVLTVTPGQDTMLVVMAGLQQAPAAQPQVVR